MSKIYIFILNKASSNADIIFFISTLFFIFSGCFGILNIFIFVFMTSISVSSLSTGITTAFTCFSSSIILLSLSISANNLVGSTTSFTAPPTLTILFLQSLPHDHQKRI